MIEVLPTIGEIAIVIAGFSGLVIAMRPELVAENSVHGTRLRLLVAQTILLLFLCFLPYLLLEFEGNDPAIALRYSVGVMAITVGVMSTWRMRAFMRSSALDRGSTGIIVSVLCGYGVLTAVCIVHFFGGLSHSGGVIYFGGILLMLLTSCGNFLLLLFVPRENRDDS